MGVAWDGRADRLAMPEDPELEQPGVEPPVLSEYIFLKVRREIYQISTGNVDLCLGQFFPNIVLGDCFDFASKYQNFNDHLQA